MTFVSRQEKRLHMSVLEIMSASPTQTRQRFSGSESWTLVYTTTTVISSESSHSFNHQTAHLSVHRTLQVQIQSQVRYHLVVSGYHSSVACTMSVHLSPFDRHVQLGISHKRTHLHARSSKTTSGAGGKRIHRMSSLPLSSVHPHSVGLGTTALACRLHFQIAAW